MYGHTIPFRLIKQQAKPPLLLYHGTAYEVLPLIMKEGLKPMLRQYIHLSTELEIAKKVGLRKSNKSSILIIYANEAYKEGVKFYLGNDKVWLADYVPTSFLKVYK